MSECGDCGKSRWEGREGRFFPVRKRGEVSSVTWHEFALSPGLRNGM